MDNTFDEPISSGCTVGIMQPYFIPYWGYFAHINQCDFWIVFDQPKYSRKTWLNRNYVQNARGERDLISLPVTFQSSLTKTIRDAVIQPEALHDTWLIQKLSHYAANHYTRPVRNIIGEAYDLTKSNRLAELNTNILSKICAYLNIEFKYLYSSQIDYDIDSVKESGDWAFEISKALDAQKYLNPLSGLPIFDPKKFETQNIELMFFKTNGFPFTRSNENQPLHFSIIDTILRWPPEEIKKAITNNIELLSWENAALEFNSKRGEEKNQ